MLTIATLLWDSNGQSLKTSRMYDEVWVTRLKAGFSRHLTKPFQFVLFTDRRRPLPGDIMQILLNSNPPNYGACIEPYRLGVPMILVGLDTVVIGNIDHLADYCLTEKTLALPADPYHPGQVCNGVALVPRGCRNIYEEWRGENDMEWVRKFPHKTIDLLFRGHVESFKGSVKDRGLNEARIVFFHGKPKMHELTDLPWIRKHWLGE